MVEFSQCQLIQWHIQSTFWWMNWYLRWYWKILHLTFFPRFKCLNIRYFFFRCSSMSEANQFVVKFVSLLKSGHFFVFYRDICYVMGFCRYIILVTWGSFQKGHSVIFNIGYAWVLGKWDISCHYSILWEC